MASSNAPVLYEPFEQVLQTNYKEYLVSGQEDKVFQQSSTEITSSLDLSNIISAFPGMIYSTTFLLKEKLFQMGTLKSKNKFLPTLKTWFAAHTLVAKPERLLDDLLRQIVTYTMATKDWNPPTYAPGAKLPGPSHSHPLCDY